MLQELKSLLNQFQSNVYVRACTVAIGMAITDAIWARYVSAIASSSKLEAAIWGVLVIVLGAYVVISYVADKRMLVAAAIGAFIGTYLAV